MLKPNVIEETEIRLKKTTGAHYTPAILARFVAEKILSGIEKYDHKTLRILDPAVGDGELLEALANALLPVLPKGCKVEMYGFDTSQIAVENARQRLAKLPKTELHLEAQDFLKLLANRRISLGKDWGHFDIIISNPPYVRTQVMGADTSQKLAEIFGLTGRVDLYYIFIRGIGELLRPGGIVGLICSNRFMTVKSGIEVRKHILDTFDMLHVWDLGDSRLFQAAVLPAVLLMRRKGAQKTAKACEFSSIYTTSEKSDLTANDCLQAIEMDGLVAVGEQGFAVRKGFLDTGITHGDTWALANKKSDVCSFTSSN